MCVYQNQHQNKQIFRWPISDIWVFVVVVVEEEEEEINTWKQSIVHDNTQIEHHTHTTKINFSSFYWLERVNITNYIQWSVCINTVSPNGRYLRRLGWRLQEGLLTQASSLFLSGVQLPAIWNWPISSTGQIYFQSGKYSYFKGTSCIFLLNCKVTQEYTLFIALAFIHVFSKAFVTVINAWGARLECQLNFL